ncbi:MAG: sigma-70 family RNA polymerase sigma factor [Endomicrobia bacterium]|nr:sigma-70 family RNA polymerase sigma factor [Endomicrobiia bacterium]MCL2507298.1 sigma-70 family RNA polymerase sigma factor [Endomicrobiia bacterium]
MHFGNNEIKKYRPLVYAVVKRYKTFFPQIDTDELTAEGERGLFEASLKYNKNSPAAFSTYAWYRIVKNIQEYISKNIAIIEMPQTVRKIFASIKKIVDNEAKSGRNADISKIAKILNLTTSEISDVIVQENNIINSISLDKEIDIGDGQKSLAELVEDKSQKNIFDSLSESEDMSRLEDMMSNLSENERIVLCHRFGLDGKSGKKVSLKSIAEELGLSASKVKDLEKGALIKLRGMMEKSDE